MLAIALALSGAVCWGAADFFGGLASRRAAALTVVALSQAVGLALALGLLLIVRPEVPPVEQLALGALAGISGVAGLVAFYRGLAIGSMGIVAPVSGLGALVPIAVDLSRGNSPGTLALVGMVVALGGVFLAARAPGPASRRGIGLALLAALGFGGFFVLLAAAATDSALWALAAARGGSLPLLLVALAIVGAGGGIHGRRLLAIVVAAGFLDCTANLFFAAGTREGLVSVVAVIGSLYPVVTVALASVVLRERLGPLQAAGSGVAIAGAALIAVG